MAKKDFEISPSGLRITGDTVSGDKLLLQRAVLIVMSESSLMDNLQGLNTDESTEEAKKNFILIGLNKAREALSGEGLSDIKLDGANFKDNAVAIKVTVTADSGGTASGTFNL